MHIPSTLAFAAPMLAFGHQLESSGLVGKVQVETWASVDVLTSLLLNNGTDVAAAPSYVSANLFNKGADLRLAAITVWGMLYVAGPADAPTNDLGVLRGVRIGVPLPNNMPDLVFRYLLGQQGIDVSELEIVPFNDTQELLTTFVRGAIDWAVLPEHAVTMALSQATAQGRQAARVIDLQQIWAQVTGAQPRFPMAGIVVPTGIAEQTKLLGAILDDLESAVNEVNQAGEAIVQRISEATSVPGPIVTQVIPRLQLEVVPAANARDELTDFYTRLATLNPGIIGGRVPSEEFFLTDPR